MPHHVYYIVWINYRKTILTFFKWFRCQIEKSHHIIEKFKSNKIKYMEDKSCIYRYNHFVSTYPKNCANANTIRVLRQKILIGAVSSARRIILTYSRFFIPVTRASRNEEIDTGWISYVTNRVGIEQSEVNVPQRRSHEIRMASCNNAIIQWKPIETHDSSWSLFNFFFIYFFFQSTLIFSFISALCRPPPRLGFLEGHSVDAAKACSEWRVEVHRTLKLLSLQVRKMPGFDPSWRDTLTLIKQSSIIFEPIYSSDVEATFHCETVTGTVYA